MYEFQFYIVDLLQKQWTPGRAQNPQPRVFIIKEDSKPFADHFNQVQEQLQSLAFMDDLSGENLSLVTGCLHNFINSISNVGTALVPLQFTEIVVASLHNAAVTKDPHGFLSTARWFILGQVMEVSPYREFAGSIDQQSRLQQKLHHRLIRY